MVHYFHDEFILSHTQKNFLTSNCDIASENGDCGIVNSVHFGCTINGGGESVLYT